MRLRECQFSNQRTCPAPPGLHVLGEFLFGDGDNLSGIFIFSSGGLLSGLEVYGLAADAPRVLLSPEELRPFETGLQS